MSTPELTRLDEFEAILKNYHVSHGSQEVLNNTALVILTAPAGGGRNTIIRELEKTGDFHFIVSDTTRPKRYNDGVYEQDGVEYWFRSEDDFLQDLKDGKYLEAEVLHRQQVSGISIRELQRAHDEHKIAINDVDIGGAHNIVRQKPDTFSIIVLPPSFNEWQRRFMGRGEISEKEHRRRLTTACTIFADALNHDYLKFVINDTVAHAAQQINDIAKEGIIDAEQQARGYALAEQLLKETKDYLARP